MQILESSQVKFCNVVKQVNNDLESFLGVAYQGKLFANVGAFSREDGQAAVKRGRELFLQSKGLIQCLVIEEQTGFTVWCQENDLQIVDENKLASDRIAQINLEQLVARMRNVGGLKIQDRRFRLTNYPRCFVGSEATQWIMDRLEIPEAEAVRLGQRLIDEKWLHHVLDEHDFKNEDLFYRFYWDEQ
ncbi:pleckstrin/ G-protein interacting- domain protein [Thalassoporum mexicanum PCC 7367]|uniref:pleckstrin/ G-protein interacting- domain-containing protein n=1 Tax=Thalassoporum mexicanum TaxID=3457544 RepID=UPI00029FA9DE|nr:pleckstrin/ G-protein interacting- domain-containing protein [Pseudanabaena sp. PCC 7367]AFY70306.1 pleckstrin/ G-protein interacting- domain protein [Pseudanabaena sp. PCC 7367]